MRKRGGAVGRKFTKALREARVAAEAEMAQVDRIATIELYESVRRMGIARTATLFDVPPSQVSAAYETMTGRSIDSGMAMHGERVSAARTVFVWSRAAGQSDGQYLGVMQALLDITLADAKRLWLEVRDGDGIQDDLR